MAEVEPEIAARKPAYCELAAGQRIMWCACGRSQSQPFCDGASHVGTPFRPMAYRASRDEEVLLCVCKRTSTPPFCDGTHSNLPGGYSNEEPDAAAKTAAPVVCDEDGYARLDGACFVVSPVFADADREHSFRMRPLVLPSTGAEHQSQFYVELDEGRSKTLRAGGDVVIWIARGDGHVVIGDRRLAITAPCGVHVCARETFRFEGDGLAAYISVCPMVDALEIVPDEDVSAFDASMPRRVAGIDEDARQAMGPRYFQVLLDDRDGLENSAQFIGHIPRSKAAMHRHLYEEALIIVAGEGTIWNERTRADVRAGDVIFFPRKHIHSLECTAEQGMDVLGFIHPGTNPGINY